MSVLSLLLQLHHPLVVLEEPLPVARRDVLVAAVVELEWFCYWLATAKARAEALTRVKGPESE